MCVAYAVGENFKIAAIGLAAHNHPAVGVIPMLAGGVGIVKTHVANAVVDAAIRPHCHTGHAVPTKTDVYAKTIAQGLLAIGQAIAIRVFHSPGLGCAPTAWRVNDTDGDGLALGATPRNSSSS